MTYYSCFNLLLKPNLLASPALFHYNKPISIPEAIFFQQNVLTHKTNLFEM